MDNSLLNRQTNICAECGSDYFIGTSFMSSLCPECSHVLYGYKNCDHHFQNGRCVNCFWNGNTTDYVSEIKNREPNKAKE
jgi:predicted RNA-binding Zn-ribbon protein involved in translation (DUF1610 family)